MNSFETSFNLNMVYHCLQTKLEACKEVIVYHTLTQLGALIMLIEMI